MNRTRRISAILLFLALAATAWLFLHEALRQVDGRAHQNTALDPGYQHSERLKVAAARGAMDALGMSGSGPEAANYSADYRIQKIQIQADSEGLERWAAHDIHHQGLLLEIRASLAALTISLDQTSGNATASGAPSILLLPALNRAESALSNYSASLTEPRNLATRQYIFSGPVALWWLLILILLEAAMLAWLAFSATEELL